MRVALALLILSLVVFSVSADASSDGGWVPIIEDTVVYAYQYDIDGDGEVEVVTDRYILDSGQLIDIQDSVLAKFDYDMDGLLELVQYTPDTGKLYIYNEGEIIVKNASRNKLLQLNGNTLQIGSYLYGFGATIAIPTETKAQLVIHDGDVYAVYIDDKGLKMYNGLIDRQIYPIVDGTLITALVVGDTVYALIDVEGVTILLEYSIVESKVFITELENRVSSAVPYGNVFLASIQSNIYVLTVDGVLTPTGLSGKLQYPLGTPDRFAVISPSGVTIATVTNGAVTILKELPPLVEVSNIDVYNDYIIASSVGGVFLFIDVLPDVDVDSPSTVYAGEEFQVEVDGVFDYVVISAGNREVKVTAPGTVTLRVDNAGETQLLYTACLGGYCISDSKTIVVQPRPLTVVVEGPTMVKPYSEFEVSVTVLDGITGEDVRSLVCVAQSLSDGTVKKVRPPSDTVRFTAIPVKMETVISVSCSGDMYGVVKKVFIARMSEYYYAVSLSYEGEGTYRVYAFNKYTGEAFPGEIRVVVNDSIEYNLVNNSTFGLSPGKYNIEIILLEDRVPVGVFNYTLSYFEDLELAPETDEIMVADRIVEVTQTVTETQTKTETRVIEVEVVRVPVAIALIVISFSVGVFVSYLLLRR